MKITLHPSNNPQVEDIQLRFSYYSSEDDKDVCEDALNTFLTYAANIVIEYRNSINSSIISMLKEVNGDVIIEINSDNSTYEITQN